MLHGAHGGVELDQDQEPRSLNSRDRAQRVAQVATVDREVRDCCSSIIKKKGLSKTWPWRGGLHWLYEGHRTAYWHRVKGQAALFERVQDSG